MAEFGEGWQSATISEDTRTAERPLCYRKAPQWTLASS